jgi:Asp-tRNA(Asn)/Glu-tRNA(Gln) amidotransferase A subunit family amidase
MMTSGKVTSEEVVTAFCKRAAIAHQVVNCLTEIFFKEAIERARECDEYYKREGKGMGALHGLPVSLKVCRVEVET